MEFTKREYQQFYHGISLSLLSKKSAQKWRYDDETAEEIRFLEGLESKVLDKIKQADTPQTAKKVEEFQALCGIEIDPDDINRRVANAYAECGMNEAQTDCCWK